MTQDRSISFEEEEEQTESFSSGKNHLLAIGIDKYEHCSPLLNAVKDASDVAGILQEHYGFSPEHVQLLTDEEATEFNIFAAFRKLIRKVKPEDNVLIFFSGHGHFDKDFQQGYWIPVNAAEDAIGDFIPNSEIATTIRAIPSKHTLMIADACFSGSLFGENRSVMSSFNTSEYLQRVAGLQSRWGLASGRNEVVSDGEPGNNSPFSESLIYFLRNHLKRPFATSELVQYVKTVTANNAEQTPIGSALRNVGDKGGEFVFYPRQVQDGKPERSGGPARRDASANSTSSSTSNANSTPSAYAPQNQYFQSSHDSQDQTWLKDNVRTLSLVALTTLFFGLWGTKMFFIVPITLLAIMLGVYVYDLKGKIKTRFVFMGIATVVLGIAFFYAKPLAKSATDPSKWIGTHKVFVFVMGLVCLIGWIHFMTKAEEGR